MKRTLHNFSLLLALVLSFNAYAEELIIRITEGMKEGMPVMLVPFQGGNSAHIIEANLSRSGRFTFINPDRAGQALAYGQSFQVDKLRSSGAEYVIVGREINGLEFEIIHAATGQKSAVFRISQHPSPRRMAHKASDLIYERLIGIKGAFDTRLAYIKASGPPRAQTYELVVADADGHNPQTIFRSMQPIMSPAWAPNGRQLAYVSFETGNSAIFVQDLSSGQKRLISNRPGINGAPAWSPDGRLLAVSLSEAGSPSIYTMDANGNNLRRVTESSAIDTEPTWANNQTLVYTSDQSGQPQVYRINSQGGASQRLTTEGRYNSAPSVVGNQIAMVRQFDGVFKIVLMNASSRQITTISKGRFDESPSLSPNGSMVVYATKVGGRSVLVVSSANGKAHQTLAAAQGDVRDPAWSNYLD